jgi:hypothetical protein
VSVGKVLQTLTLLEPLVGLVERWLDGDDSDEAAGAVNALPAQLKSRLSLERAKRRPPPVR